MRLLLPTLLSLALCASGCSEERDGELREWTPEDHQQPPAPDPEPSQAEEAPSQEMIVRAVRALFDARCASCHGAEGRGDGAQAAGQTLPDFTSAAFQAGRSDEEIAAAIRGEPGSSHEFGRQLNERGIAALVGHIRRLGAREGAGGAPDASPEGGGESPEGAPEEP